MEEANHKKISFPPDRNNNLREFSGKYSSSISQTKFLLKESQKIFVSTDKHIFKRLFSERYGLYSGENFSGIKVILRFVE